MTEPADSDRTTTPGSAVGPHNPANPGYELDIADWTGRPLDLIPDDIIEKILTKYPVPDASYVFPPQCIYNHGKKENRKFPKEELTKVPWLIWSKKFEGPMCKYCPLFKPNDPKKYNQTSGGWNFVDRPFLKYKKVREAVSTHGAVQYHLEAVDAARSWLK